jgi:hypothetical protein
VGAVAEDHRALRFKCFNSNFNFLADGEVWLVLVTNVDRIGVAIHQLCDAHREAIFLGGEGDCKRVNGLSGRLATC